MREKYVGEGCAVIRLIVSDMDDTLLDPKGNVTERTLSALQAAIKAGALVTFASGRMVESATGWAHQLGVNAPLILYNGGLVYDLETKKTISRIELPEEIARAVLRFGEQMGVYMQVYPGENYYCVEKNRFTENYANRVRVEACEIPKGQKLSEWIDSGQMKLLVIGDAEDMPQVLDAFRAEFPDCGVEFFMSRPMYLEAVSESVNKGSALRALAESLGIAPDEILAFGDGENDITMLEYAGHSYAVANAREDVIEKAKFTAPSNAEDGVAQVIEKYLAEGKIGRG